MRAPEPRIAADSAAVAEQDTKRQADQHSERQSDECKRPMISNLTNVPVGELVTVLCKRCTLLGAQNGDEDAEKKDGTDEQGKAPPEPLCVGRTGRLEFLDRVHGRTSRPRRKAAAAKSGTRATAAHRGPC